MPSLEPLRGFSALEHITIKHLSRSSEFSQFSPLQDIENLHSMHLEFRIGIRNNEAYAPSISFGDIPAARKVKRLSLLIRCKEPYVDMVCYFRDWKMLENVVDLSFQYLYNRPPPEQLRLMPRLRRVTVLYRESRKKGEQSPRRLALDKKQFSEKQDYIRRIREQTSAHASLQDKEKFRHIYEIK